jgi:hypothetical protein
MPQHNFMVEDLRGALTAIALFPQFLIMPGYVLGWCLNLFEFRGRSLQFRLAFAIPLSISSCPVLTYLGGRFASMTAVWLLYAASAVAFLFLIIRDRKCLKLPAGIKFASAAAAIWFLVAMFALIDVQIGDRLYYTTSTIDHSVRTAFIHSISTTGVPPQNPFFFSRNPAPLRYHYFWLMMCSLVNQVSAYSVSARHALMGGTFWVGIGLMALVAVYLRLFAAAGSVPYRRRVTMGFVLLAVTGLDIVPSLFFLFLYGKGMMDFVLPSVEWWNEHVDWFLYTALWAPHALAAMIACFTSFLLLWRAPSATGRARYVIPAAMGLASAAGMSIYVAFVFAIFLALWTAITWLKKWRLETAVLCAAGAGSVVLFAPYLLSLVTGPGGKGGAAQLIAVGVRAFSLAALIPTPHMSSWLRQLVVNLPLVPVNYFLEFGLFFLIARYKWLEWRKSGKPLGRGDLAFAAMAVTSVVTCTFLKSAVLGCNDLGWRGMLIAEFVLLLWAVDLFGERERLEFLSARQQQLLAVFFALGFAGTVYDMAIVRAYPVLADRGVVPPLDWMSPDRDFGHRTYAERAAYEWLRQRTPETASVQANPKVVFQDTPAMIYSERRTVAGDLTCLASFGGDPAQCPPIAAQVQAAFPLDPKQAPPSLGGLCKALPIDAVVAKDTDAVWRNRQGWVWAEHPVYASPYVRMFKCDGD